MSENTEKQEVETEDSEQTPAGSEGHEETSAEKGLKKDLIKERKKRQAAQDENESLRESIRRLSAKRRKEGGAEKLDGLNVSDDELLKGSDGVNREFGKVAERVNSLSEQVDRLTAETARKDLSSQVDQILSDFEIFEDDRVGGLAQDALVARLDRAMSDGDVDVDDLREMAEGVAGSFSKLRVDRDDAGDDGGGEDPLPGSGDSTAAAHLKEERPKTLSEVRKKSKDIIRRFAARHS